MSETATVVVRFIGDHVGYRVSYETTGSLHSGWVEAEVGNTGRVVLVNLDFAYVIEHEDAAA